MNTQFTYERRSGYDRRSERPPPEFPFFDADNTLVREDRRDPALQRRLQDSEADTLPQHQPAAAQTRTGTHKLFLWHNDNIREISDDTKMLTLGRSSDCELVVRNRYTSRVHARLERVNGQFLLVDCSTNGTYLKTAEGEVFLVGEKATLSGNGLISLGSPLEYSEEGTIHFFCY